MHQPADRHGAVGLHRSKQRLGRDTSGPRALAISPDSDDHEVPMLGEHPAANAFQTLVSGHGHDLAVLLPHQHTAIELHLRRIVTPRHQPGDDLTNLVEPRRHDLPEIEPFE